MLGATGAFPRRRRGWRLAAHLERRVRRGRAGPGEVDAARERLRARAGAVRRPAAVVRPVRVQSRWRRAALRTRRRAGDGLFLVPGAERRNARSTRSCPAVDTEQTFSQTYGRVEIRARFPDHACPGVWAALMLPCRKPPCSRRVQRPVGGEIDIAAAFGKGAAAPGKAGHGGERASLAPKARRRGVGRPPTFPSEALGYPSGAKTDSPQRVPHVRGGVGQRRVAVFRGRDAHERVDAVPRPDHTAVAVLPHPQHGRVAVRAARGA